MDGGAIRTIGPVVIAFLSCPAWEDSSLVGAVWAGEPCPAIWLVDLGHVVPVAAVPALPQVCSVTSATRGRRAEQGRKLEGGGEALSEMSEPPAGLQEDSA
jgi:hypothetical protein